MDVWSSGVELQCLFKGGNGLHLLLMCSKDGVAQISSPEVDLDHGVVWFGVTCDLQEGNGFLVSPGHHIGAAQVDHGGYAPGIKPVGALQITDSLFSLALLQQLGTPVEKPSCPFLCFCLRSCFLGHSLSRALAPAAAPLLHQAGLGEYYASLLSSSVSLLYSS